MIIWIAFCFFVGDGSPIKMNNNVELSEIYFDSKSGIILNKVKAINSSQRFEYKFNLTLSHNNADAKTKCGKHNTMKDIADKAWSKTMINLR